jgi:hypothetical protein
MKKNDIILLICIIAACAVCFSVAWALFSGTGDTVVVTVDGEEYARLPLDEDTELTIQTPNGSNTLTVRDGQAFISDADCPDKICVRTGNATELKNIVCLPHKLTVRIERGATK